MASLVDPLRLGHLTFRHSSGLTPPLHRGNPLDKDMTATRLRQVLRSDPQVRRGGVFFRLSTVSIIWIMRTSPFEGMAELRLSAHADEPGQRCL